MTCRVSVVVACYNQANYVAEALTSIQSQTVNDWETIIVDDGSTDNSCDVVRPFLRDNRFRLICNSHVGQSHAKNCGILAAQGEFIAFLDADDRWHPTKLDRQLKLFQSKPNVGVVYTRRKLIDVCGARIPGEDQRQFHRGNVLYQIFLDNFVCFSSAMIRRRVIEHIGLFDERLQLAIDFDWWLRISRFHEFDFVDVPLVEYRIGHENLSRRIEERMDTVLRIMRRFVRDIDHPQQLARGIYRRAVAETHRHRGVIIRQKQPLASVGWLLRSLVACPWAATTWKALLGSAMPTALRCALRKCIRRPDWEPLLRLVLVACCLLPAAC